MACLNRLPHFATALLLSSTLCVSSADARTARVAKAPAHTFENSPKASFTKKRSAKEIDVEALIQSLSEAFRKSMLENAASPARIQKGFEASQGTSGRTSFLPLQNVHSHTPQRLPQDLQQLLDGMLSEMASGGQQSAPTRRQQPATNAPTTPQGSPTTLQGAPTTPQGSPTTQNAPAQAPAIAHTAPYFIPPPPPGPPPAFAPPRPLVIARGSGQRRVASTPVAMGNLAEEAARRAQRMQANRNGNPILIAQNTHNNNPFANVRLRPGATPDQVHQATTNQISNFARNLRHVNGSVSDGQNAQSNQSLIGLRPSEIRQLMRAQRTAAGSAAAGNTTPSAHTAASPAQTATTPLVATAAQTTTTPLVATAAQTTTTPLVATPTQTTPVQVVQVTPGVIPVAPPLPPMNQATTAAVFGLADPGNTLGQLQAQGRVRHATLFSSLSQGNLQAGLRSSLVRSSTQPAITPPAQTTAAPSAMAALGLSFTCLPGMGTNSTVQQGRVPIDMAAIRAEAAAREAENAAQNAANQAIIEQQRLDRIARDEAERRARADAERVAQANAAIQQQRALDDARSGSRPAMGGVFASILGHNRANLTSASARVIAAAPPPSRTPLTPEQAERAQREALRNHASTALTARRAAMVDSDDDDDDWD